MSTHTYNINAYDSLLDLYSKHPQRSLSDDLAFYMREGYVFSAQSYILIGRRIGNGWFVHAAVGVGALEELIRLVPYRLPWIGWARDNGTIRWHRAEAVEKAIKKVSKLYEAKQVVLKKSNDS